MRVPGIDLLHDPPSRCLCCHCGDKSCLRSGADSKPNDRHSGCVQNNSRGRREVVEFETLQLLDGDLDQLDDEKRTLFEFADAEAIRSLDKRAPSNCKVFPGDSSWPSDSIWELFNKLTGGSLIPSVPQATPCYEDPAYDEAKCKKLSSQWTNSYIQFVNSVFLCLPLRATTLILL